MFNQERNVGCTGGGRDREKSANVTGNEGVLA